MGFKPRFTRTERRSTASPPDGSPTPVPPSPAPTSGTWGGARRAQAGLDRALGTWNGCWALGAFSEPTPEQREKQPGSTHKQRQSKETERQKFRGQSPIKMEKGVKMLPGCRASKCMEPSVQSLSHSWINVRLDGISCTLLGWAPHSIPAIILDHVS